MLVGRAHTKEMLTVDRCGAKVEGTPKILRHNAATLRIFFFVTASCSDATQSRASGAGKIFSCLAKNFKYCKHKFYTSFFPTATRCVILQNNV